MSVYSAWLEEYTAERDADEAELEKSDPFRALYSGRDDMVKKLIEGGFDINNLNPAGESLLHHAVKDEKCDLTRFLVDHGINVNLADGNGRTALSWAVEWNRYEAVCYLVDHGAEVNHLINTVDGYDEYLPVNIPLFNALIHKHRAIAKYLIDKGADINQRLGNHCMRLVTIKGATPLRFAVGDYSLVEYLIERGANISARDDNEATILHWAALYGDIKTVSLLISLGVDIDARDYFGFTPLDYSYKQAETRAYLFTKGARAGARAIDIRDLASLFFIYINDEVKQGKVAYI
jgi:ankyrin repeat protein